MTNWDGFDPFEQLVFVSGLPRWIAIQHFIKNNAKRPYITFGRILYSLQDLWSHIYRTSDARFKHLRAKVVNVLCKSKISYFVDAFVDKDVCRLQVTMNDFFPDQFGESTEYLFHDLENFIFFELFSFHHLLEIAVFTKLGNDVKTVFGAEDIFELDDVGVIEPLEKVYFGEYGIFKILVVGESSKVDLFDGHLLFGFSFHTLIDLAVDSLAQTLRSLVRIVSNHFDYNLSHQIIILS